MLGTKEARFRALQGSQKARDWVERREAEERQEKERARRALVLAAERADAKLQAQTIVNAILKRRDLLDHAIQCQDEAMQAAEALLCMDSADDPAAFQADVSNVSSAGPVQSWVYSTSPPTPSIR